jgi:hypothetical protein
MKELVLLFFSAIPSICLAQLQPIPSGSFHLRDGLRREWSSFPLHAKDSQLVIHFDSDNISGEKTISLVQSDVNHTWNIQLNGSTLGSLIVDENKQTSYFAVPTAILREKANILIIRSTQPNAVMPDDILLSNITLHDKPVDSLLSESSLNIHIDDGIPCRLTILNESNSFQPIKASPGDSLAIRSGVIYSGTGNFSFSLPVGRYKIYASRGFEYSVDSVSINTATRITKVKLAIKHEVDLKDWVSMDTHVHTLEYSGHGDASMKERVLTIAGEGLDYAVITEHNRVVNIADTVKAMKMDKWFTAIAGDELTTKVGHFNLFPAVSAPPHDVNSWTEVKDNIGKNKEVKIVILNHARDEHNGFRPADALKNLSAGLLAANAMEVFNSGSQQTDPRQLYLDWLALISRGIVLTPVGSSDSHDVSRFIVGQGRTYVRKGDIVQHFLTGKVGVSFGMFTELIIDPKKKNTVTVKVHTPSWIKPSSIVLYANGKKIHTSLISSKQKPKNNVYIRKINIPKFSNETILVAVAEGGDPSVPWWLIAKPYQHESPDLNPIVLGLTGPVWLIP